MCRRFDLVQIISGFISNQKVWYFFVSLGLLLFCAQTSLAAPLNISGTLYSDRGVTQITSGKTIKVAVATGTVSIYSTSTNSGAGTWTITIPDGHSVATGTPITAFVDGDAVDANTVTKASSTGNIINLDLYQNHVIISHEATSGTSTTNSDLSQYDTDNDSDVPFTANSGTLSVPRGFELFIKPGKTFAPGGPVLASSSLHITSGATYSAPATTTVNGTLSNQGTFTNNSGNLTMDGIYSDVVNILAGRDASGSAGGTGNVLIYSLTAVGSTLYVGKSNDATACDGTPGNAIGCELMVFGIQSNLTGTLTGSSAFNNVEVKGNGARFLSVASTSRLLLSSGTTTMDSAFSASTLTANPGTTLTLASGATTTVGTLNLLGTASSTITLNSTASGTRAFLVATSSYSVSYVNIKDSNACGSVGGAINVIGGNNIDGGNTTCWNFVQVTSVVAMAESYNFYSGQVTTMLGTITITDGETPTITAANDIRLTIATTTTNFRFDTTVTTPTFGGTASGKVAGTVSYEDGGATLVIDVTSNFTATNTLTIAGIKVGSFGSVSTTTSQLGLQVDGNATGTPAALSSQTFRITGLNTIANHDAGQASNRFSFQNRTEDTFFAFKLNPTGENATVTDMVVTLSGIQGGVTAAKLNTFKLYRDNNNDRVLDGSDSLLDSNGIMTINGQHGAITFSSDFLATTTNNYIVIANTTMIERGDALVFGLLSTAMTALGQTSGFQTNFVYTVSNIQHERYGAGTGGGSGRIGGEAPPGDGTVGGGGSGGGGGIGQLPDGENIAPDPDFARPSDTGTPHNEWTNPTNVYNSDGIYATASSTHRQSYINFGFNITLTNTIQGISVKLDASGSTASGTIDVALSWDNGASYTTGKATPTLVGSDIVYTVGGATDTWGRAWTAGEFASNTFLLRITAAPVSNTLRLDAFEIRVHHQAGGGGGGGGGRI